MLNALIYVAIFLAIGLAILAEILVAYQKYLMKKQYVEELDREDKQNTNVEEKR
jgi:Tfp pilus assembly major pilin PilA